ncbi:MAG: arsenite methyltransferase [Ignavibacteriaceae bacterium]|nr:arsenite methyltransferase [Ignavibacteriaceae bacterium]
MKENVKDVVKEKYAEIAEQNAGSCCAPGCCGPQILEISMIGDDYDKIEGHIDEADLGLGCGIPTEYADIKSGDTVLDLGSGAGNDAFIASKLAGPSGYVIGVDMTSQMIDRANINKEKFKFTNVEFRLGEIEALPVQDDSVNVILSNCVLNLVPDKIKAFSEIYRVLKPGGHFCISDVVIVGELPEGFKKSAELYAGCISGAITRDEYIGIIKQVGFAEVQIPKEKRIVIPEELYERYLSGDEKEKLLNSGFGIFSVTVKALKK